MPEHASAAYRHSLAPTADSRKLNRVKELQAKIQLRRTEIEALRHRREQLIEITAMRGENRAVSQEAAVGAQLLTGSSLPKMKRLQQRMLSESRELSHGQHQSTCNSPRRHNHQPTDSSTVRNAVADPADPLNLPILSFVQDSATPKSFDVFDISADQVGDIVMEIDAGIAALNHATARVEKETREYEFQTAKSHKRLQRLIEQQQLFEELTGMPPEAIVTSCVDAKSQSRRDDALDRSTAPAFRMHRACEESNPSSPRYRRGLSEETDLHVSPSQRVGRDNADLNARILLISKEIRDAQGVIAKKQLTVKDLEKVLKSQAALERGTLDIYNQIRVKDRDVREQKLVLQGLMTEHEKLDRRLQISKQSDANSVVHTMVEALTGLKHQIAFGEAEEQQVHQRVTKVQEYRLSQLQRRLKLIGLALSTHNLREDVEVMISEALELQHKQNVDAGSSYGGTNTSVGSASPGSPSRPRGRERAVGGASRVPYSPGGGSLSPSRSAAGGRHASGYSDPISMEVAHMTEEELFDVDMIVPPNERVHPAIYSLLVSERERLDKRVGLQRILLAEKGASMEMVSGKLDIVLGTYEEAVRDQRRAAFLARETEEEHKAALVERVAENREVLRGLKGEHCEMKKRSRKNAEIAKSKTTPAQVAAK